MPSFPKNKLAQLVKAERNISAFQKLANIHERALNEHNDQLDFTWKDGYQKGSDDVSTLYKPKVEAQEDQLLDQAKRHQKRVEELKAEIESNKPVFVTGELVQGKAIQFGFLVSNWRSGWKWISSWTFALIAYIAVYGIPPEIMSLLPVGSQTKVIAVLSIIGMICRFINQSKPKPLLDVKGEFDDFAA